MTLSCSSVSRLRRLALSDRFFFITCNLARGRRLLSEDAFARLGSIINSRRKVHGFLLTAWVFVPDHWHAILFPRHPTTISRVMESIKVSSTRQLNTHRKESGELWQGRFFDRALRTVKECHEKVDYLHWNPVRQGLVKTPEEWKWSSIHDYHGARTRTLQAAELHHNSALPIDRVRLPAELTARL